MLGAIVGDIVGSRFERHNHKSKDFELFTDRCRFTDDTAMTVAIAKALLECKGDYTELSDHTVRCMRRLGESTPMPGTDRYSTSGSTIRTRGPTEAMEMAPPCG